MSKSYLGDGAYVDVYGGMLKLTTEDGVSETNTIFLEPQVLKALLQYIKRSEFSLLLPRDNPTY